MDQVECFLALFAFLVPFCFRVYGQEALLKRFESGKNVSHGGCFFGQLNKSWIMVLTRFKVVYVIRFCAFGLCCFLMDLDEGGDWVAMGDL